MGCLWDDNGIRTKGGKPAPSKLHWIDQPYKLKKTNLCSFITVGETQPMYPSSRSSVEQSYLDTAQIRPKYASRGLDPKASPENLCVVTAFVQIHCCLNLKCLDC